MLSKWLQKYMKFHNHSDNRTQMGLLSGKVGLVSNLLLFVIKILAGLISGSISIITDAMNNLSDTASSILTLFGFYAAAKPADKEHPYGHERSEYISGLLISLVIIFVGGQFLITSINRIFNPTNLQMSPLIVALLVISIAAKIIQGFFYQTIAKEIKSNTLLGVAQDSFNDVYSTLVVLVASIIESMTDWNIDGFAGAFLAVFIMYSGIQMIRKSIDDLLGIRPSEDELIAMRDLLERFDSIVGYHDLLVHSYGPKKTFATIHIEIDDSWSLNQAHNLIDKIEKKFLEELDVELVCHMDPIAVHNEEHTRIYQEVKQILKTYFLNLRFHDFRIMETNENQTIQFDVVISDDTKQTDDELLAAITKNIHQQIGPYDVDIEFDRLDLLKEVEE